MGTSSRRRRPIAALLTAGVALGALLGLPACGSDGERQTLPSSAPSVERPSRDPIDRPSRTAPESPAGTTSPARTASPTTRPPRTQQTTAAPAPAPTRTTTTEATAQPAAPAPTTARTTTAAETTTSPAVPATGASTLDETAAAGSTGGLGALGWLLLVLLAAGVVGGVLIWRSKRKMDWMTGAATLVADTREVVGIRLPPVLATETPAQRALAWPPVRADLLDLAGRWALMTESAPGEQRADWSRQVWGLLQELLAAVDAENEALATGRQWRPMRLRVDDIARTLSATLNVDQGAGPEPTLT